MLSQAMLNHLLHATTMNRDGDPASLNSSEVDFGAFDAGEGGSEADAIDGGDAGTAATDGGSMAIDSDVLVVGGGSPRSPRRSRRPAKAPTCGWSPTRRARSDRPPG